MSYISIMIPHESNCIVPSSAGASLTVRIRIVLLS